MRYSSLLPLAVLAVSSACAERPRSAAPADEDLRPDAASPEAVLADACR